MIPDEDLLAEIERLADGDSPPTCTKFDNAAEYSVKTVANHFGSWSSGVRKAGYEPNKQIDVSDKDLLTEIERLADENSPPTCIEFDNAAEYSVKTVQNHFGSWNSGVRKAGFDPTHELDISDKDLLAEIERLADGDSPPTCTEFDNAAEYSVKTVENHFGSWSSGVRKAGYEPNKQMNISDKDLLGQLRADISGGTAPSKFDGHYGTAIYRNHFGSWWRAVVRAELLPYKRRPLTSDQFRQFFEAAKAQQQPKYELTALLVQFTGLTAQLLEELSAAWLTSRAGDVLVCVPEEKTASGDRWTFRIPSLWSDDGTNRETGLPGLLEWYFQQYDSLPIFQNIYDIVLRVADDAGLAEREHVTRQWTTTTPLVRPSDLRMTGGIRMARHGAPARRIRRHLGIDYTNWRASVKDFFIWCEVHDDDFSHPNWDGFD